MTDASQRVVVVEDDPTIGRALRDGLGVHGYSVEWCPDATTAWSALAHCPADLVLLDVGLPDVDGISLCRQLRRGHPELPIVLLTARSAEIDIVVGLDAGATDYVTKPFSFPVLLARVRAHLRGANSVRSGTTLHAGNIVVDLSTYQVTNAGEPVELRPKEFELLALLASEAGKVVTRNRILDELWADGGASSKSLNMHLTSLRRKLGDDGTLITTLRGVGYRLET